MSSFEMAPDRIATTTKAGLLKASGYGSGLQLDSSGYLKLSYPGDSTIKAGTNLYAPVVVGLQHKSVFYGLAAAAEDTTQASSSNAVGVYTDNAKVSIGNMLGYDARPWEFIREDSFTNAEDADHIITADANNNALDLTDLIIFFETPKSSTIASAKGSYGAIFFYYDNNNFFASESGAWTQAVDTTSHGFVVKITQELGGLFLCQETAQTTSTNSAAWRSRYYEGFTGTSQGIRFLDSKRHIIKINIKNVTGLGHYKLYGKRAIT